jgi:hypothetical protein
MHVAIPNWRDLVKQGEGHSNHHKIGFMTSFLTHVGKESVAFAMEFCSELVIITSVAMVNDQCFWKFGIAWEVKFDKLPKYLGRWSTPKSGGSHFGPKETDQ